jgi:hypothetical protein
MAKSSKGKSKAADATNATPVGPDLAAVAADAMTEAQAEKREVFLRLFADTGNVKLAADGAGVHRCTPYRWAREEPDFKGRFAEAREAALASLEDEAIRQALHQNNTTMLAFLLSANAPEKYGKKSRVELTGEGGGPIKIGNREVKDLDDNELEATIDAIESAAKG